MATLSAKDAPIVQNPTFENGVVKVLDGNSTLLTDDERRSLARFEHCIASGELSTPVPMSGFERSEVARHVLRAYETCESDESDGRNTCWKFFLISSH